MDPEQAPQPAQSAAPKKARLPWWAAVCVLLVILCSGGGFIHLVYGGEGVFTICQKDGWALEDTFVDVDEYIGQPLISLLPKAKVVRALFACKVLERPAFLDRD